MAFVKRKDAQTAGFTIAVLLSRTEVKGDIGLEIECEGNKFEKETLPKLWAYHHDGSLRGADNAEYVLKKPIAFGEVPDALKDLWAMFSKTGTVLDDSNRTSVHVHLNVQKFYLNRLTSFMAAYYTLEEILTQWCGEYRVGNLFCLRAKDASSLITTAKQFIASDGKAKFRENVHHYAALNTYALHKFGSLEFRTLRGCTDPSVILDWVSILERLYNLSADYPDPRTICDKFSSEGPLAFFDFLLGDRAPMVRSVIGWSDDQIRNSMYDGIRLAQDICYCRDWDAYSPMKLSNDPFGRPLSSIIDKLSPSNNMGEAYYEPVPEYDPNY